MVARGARPPRLGPRGGGPRRGPAAAVAVQAAPQDGGGGHEVLGDWARPTQLPCSGGLAALPSQRLRKKSRVLRPSSSSQFVWHKEEASIYLTLDPVCRKASVEGAVRSVPTGHLAGRKEEYLGWNTKSGGLALLDGWDACAQAYRWFDTRFHTTRPIPQLCQRKRHR